MNGELPLEWSVLLRWLWLPGLLVALALMALGWRRGIYPARKLCWLAMVPAVSSIMLVVPDRTWGASWAGAAWVAVLMVLNLAVVVLALRDLTTVWKLPAVLAEREYQPTASLRQRHRMTLVVSNPSGLPVRAQIRDGIPDAIETTPSELIVDLEGHSRAYLPYSLRSSRRGAFAWDRLHWRMESRQGMWQRLWTTPLPARLNVYPDMRQLAEYELLARSDRLSLMGLRRTRRVGPDHDFERLRDYTRDDNPKRIDWRATARRQKLTVKDYQTSQSQTVLFLVDCGRMMSNLAADISLLDHALNSMLMLSYIALRRGDSVGLLCFSNQIHCYVPPRHGRTQMNHLLHASFDQFPQFVESRYDEAFMYLSSHLRRRALVVLMTNVIDQVNAHQIHRYLTSIVGRHLPLAVLLRDRQLFEPIERVTGADDQTLFEGAAAAGILSWRYQVLTDLQRQGVLCLDVFPDQLTAPLINQYLDVKARGLL